MPSDIDPTSMEKFVPSGDIVMYQIKMIKLWSKHRISKRFSIMLAAATLIISVGYDGILQSAAALPQRLQECHDNGDRVGYKEGEESGMRKGFQQGRRPRARGYSNYDDFTRQCNYWYDIGYGKGFKRGMRAMLPEGRRLGQDKRRERIRELEEQILREEGEE